MSLFGWEERDPNIVASRYDRLAGFYGLFEWLYLMPLLRVRDQGLPMPRGALLFSPVTDVLEFDGESYATHDSSDPLLS